MKSKGRRQFVTTSLGAAAAAAVAAAPRHGLSAADRITVGVMGLGSRGTSLVKDLARRDDVRIAYLCDVDTRRFDRAVEAVDAAGRRPPERIQDFRKILDDPEVDALVVATSYHWHGLPTILACQAGKDVYVEKPCSHNAWEGRQMVAAARKYQRVVQAGLQNRSAPYLRAARDYVQSGRLGELHLVRVLNMNQGRLRPKGPEEPPPASLDWDTWCGPGPLVPYSSGTWHKNHYDYSVGFAFDDGVHQLDAMRIITGLGAPRSVVHAGGVRQLKDGRETPDTMVATYEYPGLTLVYQATLWASYIKETPSVVRDGDRFPDWLFNGTKIELFGSEGMMLAGRMGGGWQAYDQEGKLVESAYGRQYSHQHMTDFLECVRSRRRPNGDIEETFPSDILYHLANASYRSGNRKLDYDADTGLIRNDDEASRFMKRKGREPWAIPDEV